MSKTAPLRKIMELCESGSRPKGGVKGIRDGVPSVGGEHLNSNGGFNFKNVRYVPPAFAKSMTRGQLQVGDVLVVKDGATTGKVSLVRPNFPYKQAVINEHVFRVRPVEGFNSAFLFYFLFSRTGQHQILSDFRGAAQGGISQGFVDKVFVPVYSIENQTRIVNKIEELFSELDASVKELKDAQIELKRYRVSVLAAACSGELVPTEAELARAKERTYENAADLLERILKERRERWNSRGKYREPAALETLYLPVLPEGWTWASVAQLSFVGTGATPNRGVSSYYHNGSIPWVTSGALNDTQVRKASEFVTEKALKETNLTLYPAGTLLLAMYGEGKTRGKCSELMIPATTNQAIAAVQVVTPDVKNYLKMFFWKNYEDVRTRSSGGVQPNLNLSIVASITVPLPPLPEQTRIVAEVERRLSVADEIEEVLSANLQRAERLRQSILQQAFSGKLVPQNANDELVATPLERINAERINATPRKKVISKKRRHIKATKK
jgi:type I restriction enzyme S subunit